MSIYVLYKYDIFFSKADIRISLPHLDSAPAHYIMVSSFPCNKLIYIVYFIYSYSDAGSFSFRNGVLLAIKIGSESLQYVRRIEIYG